MAPDLRSGSLEQCHPVVVDPEHFGDVAARRIAAAVRQACSERDSISLALSGGRSPGPIYRLLAIQPELAWQRVRIYFADERAVPPDDPESNYRLVRESLLDRLPLPPAAVHRMEADRADLDRAAADYASLLPPALDILVLGMGEDGHTASLFPGHGALSEGERLVLAVRGTAPLSRLTITPPVITSAQTRIMLVTGPAKSEAVARACQGPFDPLACPAQLARGGEWIVDGPAASHLR